MCVNDDPLALFWGGKYSIIVRCWPYGCSHPDFFFFFFFCSVFCVVKRLNVVFSGMRELVALHFIFACVPAVMFFYFIYLFYFIFFFFFTLFLYVSGTIYVL